MAHCLRLHLCLCVCHYVFPLLFPLPCLFPLSVCLLDRRAPTVPFNKSIHSSVSAISREVCELRDPLYVELLLAVGEAWFKRDPLWTWLQAQREADLMDIWTSLAQLEPGEPTKTASLRHILPLLFIHFRSRSVWFRLPPSCVSCFLLRAVGLLKVVLDLQGWVTWRERINYQVFLEN